jgi:hypothetical protein
VNADISAFYDTYNGGSEKEYMYMHLGGAVGFADAESRLIGTTAKIDMSVSSQLKSFYADRLQICVRVGGLIGLITDNAGIECCAAEINMLYSEAIEKSQKFTYEIGDLVGRTAGNAIIAESFANGSITENSVNDGGKTGIMLYIGGFAGINNASIRDCYARVDITKNDGATASNIGGFVGYNSGSILTSYSAGTVNAPKGPIGGFVGLEAEGGLVNKCFTTSNVTANDTANVNRFTGQTSGGSVLGSYYATDASFTVNGEAQTAPDSTAKGAATGQLCSTSLLTGTLRWNTNVWNITGTGLPTLLWE